MTAPTPQYTGPKISPTVDWEIRFHLQQIYQKLGNHFQGISMLTQQVDSLESEASASTTVEPVAGGGTGASNLPINRVLLGNGTSPIQAVPSVSSMYYLVDSGPGNAPAFIPLTAKQYTYSGLVAAFPSPTFGQIVLITDSNVDTWGTLVTSGGGPFGVLAWCNSDSGASWAVFAK